MEQIKLMYKRDFLCSHKSKVSRDIKVIYADLEKARQQGMSETELEDMKRNEIKLLRISFNASLKSKY